MMRAFFSRKIGVSIVCLSLELCFLPLGARGDTPDPDAYEDSTVVNTGSPAPNSNPAPDSSKSPSGRTEKAKAKNPPPLGDGITIKAIDLNEGKQRSLGNPDINSGPYMSIGVQFDLSPKAAPSPEVTPLNSSPED